MFLVSWSKIWRTPKKPGNLACWGLYPYHVVKSCKPFCFLQRQLLHLNNTGMLEEVIAMLKFTTIKNVHQIHRVAFYSWTNLNYNKCPILPKLLFFFCQENSTVPQEEILRSYNLCHTYGIYEKYFIAEKKLQFAFTTNKLSIFGSLVQFTGPTSLDISCWRKIAFPHQVNLHQISQPDHIIFP